MATFDERYGYVPVPGQQDQATPSISDVEGQSNLPTTYKTVPVDYDPFSKESKGILESAKDKRASDYQKLLYNGPDRYQMLPERLVRRLTDIVTGQVQPYNPSTGEYNVEAGLDVAGLLGGAPLGMKGASSVGNSAVRLMSDTQKPGLAIAMAKPVEPFYSAVEHAVTNVSQPKMTGQQWLGTLSNKPGVKPEELDWIGLKQYLSENADKVVTKPEVQNFVKENKVSLGEVNKGKLEEELKRKVLVERGFSSEQIDRYDEPISNTKYHDYQLSGASNYREKLLTLPVGSKNEVAQRMFQKNYDELQPQFKDQVEQELINPSRSLPDTYKSSHWEEPNILAHIRMNDRTMHEPGYVIQNVNSGNKSVVFPTRELAEQVQQQLPASVRTKIVEDIAKKKSLHIEEIQSDWHQQGRDKGYRGNNSIIKRQAEIEKRLDEIIATKKDAAQNDPEYLKLRDELFANQKAETAERNGVPDAPFKKSWHELALKRMIREAAEGGYQRLSWTPGEAQAARYDLSKQVDEVRLVPKNKNTDPAFEYRIDAFKNGERVVTKTANNEKDVADIVGKDVAKKLFEENKDNKGSSLKGQQLSIGGEGMKGFYDQIIPKSIEKISKEHGVKVKQGNLNVPQNEEWEVIGNGNRVVSRWNTEAKAKRHASEVGSAWDKIEVKKTKGSEIPIHYIDIPPSLREHALKRGFPLFSSSPLIVPVDHNPFERKQ